MGWVVYYYANSTKYYAKDIDALTDDKLFSFPGVAVVMFRISWSHLEPEEGRYRWDLIDEPAKRFIKKGIKIGIRVSCSENVPGQPYATPKWVFDAGAKSHRFRPGYPGVLDEVSGENREPDFNDEIFLKKFENFLKEFSKRYDGARDVAFVDIGSFGVYGEGHTWSSTKIGYQDGVIQRHILLHKKYFKNTVLVANHNFADYRQDGVRDWSPIYFSANNGLAFRDDSILVDKGKRAFYDQAMSDLFFRKQPVILETGEYSSRLKSGRWDPDKVIQAVKEYRASYLGAYWSPYDYWQANKNLVLDVNRIIGYRYNISSVSYASEMTLGTKQNIVYVVQNVGVAKCLSKGWFKWSLLDKNGNLVWGVIDQDFDVCGLYRDAIGGAKLKRDFSFYVGKKIPAGEYDLVFSVVDEKDVPWLELPLNNIVGNKTYAVGRVVIK